MTNYLIRSFLWFRERGFVQITQKTLVILTNFFQFLIGCQPLKLQVRCLLIFLVF